MKFMSPNHRPTYLLLIALLMALIQPDSTFSQQTAEELVNGGIAEQNKGDLCQAETIRIETKSTERQSQLEGIEAFIKNYQSGLNGVIADYTNVIEPNRESAFFFDSITHKGYAYLLRGLAKRAKGDHNGAMEDLDGAITDCTNFIGHNPKDALAYDVRGLAKQAKGDLDGAIVDFSRLIELNPTDVNAYLNRGKAKKAKGDLAGAEEDFAQAKKLQDAQNNATPPPNQDK